MWLVRMQLTIVMSGVTKSLIASNGIKFRMEIVEVLFRQNNEVESEYSLDGVK